MKRIVYEKQQMRKSYLNEILQSEKLAHLRFQYSSWIFSKPKENLSKSSSMQQERVVLCYECHISFGDDLEYNRYYLMISTLGVYVIERHRCFACDT